MAADTMVVDRACMPSFPRPAAEATPCSKNTWPKSPASALEKRLQKGPIAPLEMQAMLTWHQSS